ncbi:heterokaryon incompatibility, partial [Lasiosphaeria miniovina]
FEAISYTWGSAAQPSFIVVHGNDNKRYRIPVTQNAFSVLQNRSSTRARLVWIDSICINQHDAAEKTHQVSLMRHIYQRATRVVVWLGGSTIEGAGEEARNAKSMLYEVAFLAWFYQPRVLADRLHARYAHHWVAEPLRSRWRALIALFANPYWNRLWVVQEIALA